MAELIAIGYPDETTAVLKTSLSKEAERKLQDALHGQSAG